MLPKATKTRAMIKTVDDVINLQKQLSVLMKIRIPLRIYTDLRPLLESICSTKQIEEKHLRQYIANLKQLLGDKDMDQYPWIKGTVIVADTLTNEG